MAPQACIVQADRVARHRSDPRLLQNIGMKLRSLRTEARLTQEALAAKVDLVPKTLSLIEAGKLAPTVTTLQRLSAACGVTLSEFFVESSTSSPSAAAVWRADELGRLVDQLPQPERDALVAFLRVRVGAP